MARFRGALGGFGAVAENAHLPGFAAHGGFEIAAVAEENPERLRRVSALLPGARRYRSLDELLAREQDLDFVDIATPPFLHARQALSALSRGRHVLCEKPLTVDPEELRAVSEAAARAERCVFTVDNWKHSPLYLKVWELADSGALGEVFHAELHVLRDKPSAGAGAWRTLRDQALGGILVDHGWHALYLLRRLLGEGPVAARARLSAGQAEDEAAVFLEWPKASALVLLSWKAAGRANAGLVAGRKATLEIKDDHLTLTSPGKSERFEFRERLSGGSAHPDWFAAMLRDFESEAVGPSRGANLREAAFCAETIARLYERSWAKAA